MSKIFVGIAFAVATLGAPVLSFAQSNAPLTRAEVRADLVRVEKAGYTPGANDINYPSDIQAAEAKIAAQEDPQLANQAVGGVAENGSSASGAPTRLATHTATHTGMQSDCVGPVSFCNVFFGS